MSVEPVISRAGLRRRKVFAVLPTLLTLCNAACGFAAVTITARVGPEHFGGSELITASQLIFLAMLFDMLDGSAARLTNQTSDFGAQLDSLCDAISFGLAPAFIFLQLSHPDHHLMDTVSAAPFQFHPRLLWAIAVLFMTCAILRLARFNVETDDEDSHEFFSGLPSPAAAGVVASLPIGLEELKGQMSVGGSLHRLAEYSHWVWSVLVLLVPLITLGTAILMVSRLRYAHVFNQLVRGRRGRRQILQIVFSLVLVFVVRELALPVLFCFFAFSAPCRAAWQRRLKRRTVTDARAA
ncbi:MAG UNVERIFIED_CONTAM: CDP-alcohol phosphatidyltransferase family protein [Planctomycetaceae bacterium]|jgi:CDP-diacylglycerol--serine O-phosphatidyltransferase